jgi:hypothetical protein
MAHYRARAANTPDIAFVDITAPDFDAPAHGLDPRRIHQVMHVKVGDEVRTGLEAFIAIWEVVPGYRWLARFANLPGAHLGMHLGYHAFARVRPYLPRRKVACDSGACRRD